MILPVEHLQLFQLQRMESMHGQTQWYLPVNDHIPYTAWSDNLKPWNMSQLQFRLNVQYFIKSYEIFKTSMLYTKRCIINTWERMRSL